MELIELAATIEAYDPKASPDNRADELGLHQDVVMATGIGTMNPSFEATFLRSLDAAMSLVPEGWRVSRVEEDFRSGRWHAHLAQRVGEALLKAFDEGRTIGWDTTETEPDGAATPALAICAASLRAIANKEPTT